MQKSNIFSFANPIFVDTNFSQSFSHLLLTVFAQQKGFSASYISTELVFAYISMPTEVIITYFLALNTRLKIHSEM